MHKFYGIDSLSCDVSVLFTAKLVVMWLLAFVIHMNAFYGKSINIFSIED